MKVVVLPMANVFPDRVPGKYTVVAGLIECDSILDGALFGPGSDAEVKVLQAFQLQPKSLHTSFTCSHFRLFVDGACAQPAHWPWEALTT